MLLDEIELEVGEEIKQLAEPYEDYYITSFGTVISAKRLVHREMKLYQNTKGYMTVKLNGKNFQVHGLVAEAFIGQRDEGLEVRHMDGVPSNNHLDNLKYGTRSENQLDRRTHGTDARGEKHWKAVLTSDMVCKIRQEYAAGVTQRELAERHSVGQPNISRIVNYKLWQGE
jgi:hypothetical protein